MKNIKYVIVFSVTGFILSLLCGLISGANAGRVFLFALLFAAVFGGLSILISFIYNKFLYIENSSPEQTNIQNEQNFVNQNQEKVSPLGQNVNLVIQDEDLEQSGNSTHYVVGDNHQMLNDTDYTHNKTDNTEQTSSPEKPADEFVPIRNYETVNNFSSNESINSTEANNKRDAAVEKIDQKSENLDVLPDMSDMTIGNSSSEDEEDSDTVVL